MSIYDYEKGLQLELFCLDNSIHFYAVVQCAMRMADTMNTEKMKLAWPEVYEELRQRYNAPGGYLEGEKE